MSKHTPGRVKVHANHGYVYGVITESEEALVETVHNHGVRSFSQYVAVPDHGHSAEEGSMVHANMSRLRDCWNGCESIADPSVVPELVATLKSLRALVAESEGVAGYHRNGEVMAWGEWEDLSLESLDALLAKVGGGG